MDRRTEKLHINSIHAEPGAPGGKDVSSKIGETIAHLGEFLGAKEVVYTARVPKAWRNSLRCVKARYMTCRGRREVIEPFAGLETAEGASGEVARPSRRE